MSASILIVEDEYILAKDLCVTLEDLGYKVVGIVQSGQEAIVQLEEKIPDLIFMDIKLSGKSDGIETSRKIREKSDVPIIFITGNVDIKTRKRARKISRSAFLHKPFVESELSSAMDTALY